MSAEAVHDVVHVEAAARLHFGVLDLRGAQGRWFGGIGAAAPGPTLHVTATHAPVLQVAGEDAARAYDFAARVLQAWGIESGAAVQVHRALPPHAGLGSGTQLALAVARALAELHGRSAEPAALAQAVGRGRRSAVGTWTFGGGGLVVEGGRRPGHDGPGPLLARLPFPPGWRVVVAIPTGPEVGGGLSGPHEEAALAELPVPAEDEVHRVSHLALLALLPAVADGDLTAFGAALTRIQEITGGWFAEAQGGPFAAGPSADLVRRMYEWGVPGIGQSSWGPTVYGVVEGDAAAARLADDLRAALDTLGGGAVHEGPFPVTGSRLWVTSATKALSRP